MMSPCDLSWVALSLVEPYSISWPVVVWSVVQTWLWFIEKKLKFQGPKIKISLIKVKKKKKNSNEQEWANVP